MSDEHGVLSFDGKVLGYVRDAGKKHYAFCAATWESREDFETMDSAMEWLLLRTSSTYRRQAYCADPVSRIRQLEAEVNKLKVRRDELEGEVEELRSRRRKGRVANLD